MRSSFDALKIDDRLEVSKSLTLLVCSFATFEAEVFVLKIGLIDSTPIPPDACHENFEKNHVSLIFLPVRVYAHTHTHTYVRTFFSFSCWVISRASAFEMAQPVRTQPGVPVLPCQQQWGFKERLCNTAFYD